MTFNRIGSVAVSLFLLTAVSCGSDDSNQSEGPAVTVVSDDTILSTSTSIDATSTTSIVGAPNDSSSSATSLPSNTSNTPTPNTSSATTVARGGSSDVVGPSIVVSSVSPSSVAVGGSVSISFTVSDAGGVSFVAAFWRTSTGSQVNACPNGSGLLRVSGSATSGSYQTQCTLPSSGIPSGTYTISLTASDNAGNTTNEDATFTVL